MTISKWLWQNLIAPVYWWWRKGTLINRARWYWQRQTRGFDDRVTWDLDHIIGDWMLPRLKRFRELHRGQPPRNMDHVSKTEVEKIQREWPNDFYLSEQEWNEILDHVIAAFEFASSEGMQHASRRDPTLYEADMARYRKGMELFGQYLLHLWW